MIEIKCQECGKPFTVFPGQAAKAKFCGNACKFAYQKRVPPRSKLPREVKPCAACGKPVEYLPSQKGSARKNARYAKKLTDAIIAECRERYAAGETQTALAREFGVGVSSMSIAIRSAVYGENVYCNAACRGAGHAKLMTGRRPSGGVYTSPSTFRLMVRREFHDRCAICGWDETPCDVAHIEARKNGGYDNIENVTMLCPNHHRKFDMGLIPVEMIRATREGVLKRLAD